MHVVYRSHGGENAKDRPSWYSKVTGLRSFCRAVEAARAAGTALEVVFLNDGPIPADRAGLMALWGDPVTISAGSNRSSYLQGVALARRRAWPADDLVLLAEDDYLWRADALTALAGAAGTVRADYFAPYGAREDHGAGPERAAEGHAGPGHGGTRATAPVWAPLESTTSTFAARAGALRQDERLIALCAYSGGDFDHTTCLTLQGRARFSLADLVDHHPPAAGTRPAVGLARTVYLTALRAAVDLRSRRRPSRRRVLVGATPQLATHMELSWIASGDWEALAAEADAWAAG